MKINTLPIFIFSLLLTFSSISQAQEGGRFFDTQHNTVLSLNEGKVLNSAGEVMFSIQGNIIFKGESTKREDILYLYKANDFFSNKTSYIYDRDMKNIQYSLRAGKIFYGSEMYDSRLLLTIKKQGKKRYEIFAGEAQEKVGYGIGDMDEIGLVAIVLGYLEQEEVKQIVGDIADKNELIPREGILGIIKPAWESNFYREWSWNGRVLEPRWGNRPEDEWVFDGDKIKPYWGANVNGGWSWDGQVLRPLWSQDTDYTYIYDGYTLRPYWDDDVQNTWIIDGDIARPKWINDPKMEYQIEGEVPIPVIAIVILGFADRQSR